MACSSCGWKSSYRKLTNIKKISYKLNYMWKTYKYFTQAAKHSPELFPHKLCGSHRWKHWNGPPLICWINSLHRHLCTPVCKMLNRENDVEIGNDVALWVDIPSNLTSVGSWYVPVIFGYRPIRSTLYKRFMLNFSKTLYCNLYTQRRKSWFSTA